MARRSAPSSTCRRKPTSPQMFVHVPGRKLLLAASSGHGFITNEDDAIAMTKAGKRVMNVKAGSAAVSARPVGGDQVAAVGENRKLLIFPLAEVPEMARGQGVILQRYKDGGLARCRGVRMEGQASQMRTTATFRPPN